jgi:hypothetical protein
MEEPGALREPPEGLRITQTLGLFRTGLGAEAY